MTRTRRRINLLCLLALLAAGCAHIATREEKADSFKPYVQDRLDGQSLRDYMALRTAFVVAGAKPQAIEVHPDGMDIDLRPADARAKVDLGSAAAIASDGYFLTAAHCVRRQPVYLIVYQPGGLAIVAARVVWSGPPDLPACDLAVLKVQCAVPAAFGLAADSEFNIGDCVVTTGAVGDAAGKLLESDPNDSPGGGLPRTTTLIHDAPLAHGDSGGPLMTLNGNLIGIEILVRIAYFGPRRGIALRPDPAWLSRLISDDRDSSKDSP
ncbi:MAG TPA: serine protease [Tepidisphaeraceae bacterium]|nr:serine protease [Tepidisphaeraceae bacterium]